VAANANPTLQVLADVVLALHFTIALFVVGGLVAIIVGNLRRWRWVNALWFRLLHLMAIVVVVIEAWSGIACPLTTLEIWLRAQSGATNAGNTATYSESFIGHWLQQMLYYSAPPWVFVIAYSVFALLVIVVWFRYPPNSRKKTLPVTLRE
jgi:hypothetical protein